LQKAEFLKTISIFGNSIYNLNMDKDLITAIINLTPREQKVIRLRYGIDDGKKRTIAEVANAFAILVKEIEQIESSALTKLKTKNVDISQY
jgi:RNA polymerase primary sigma factor